MPRKTSTDMGLDIYALREANWVCKVENRQFALAQPVKVRRFVAGLIAHIRPALNVYGCADLSEAQEAELWRIWEGHCRGLGEGMRARLLWWYWSDEGWAELQKLWEDLPTVVHMPLCTNRTLVHSLYTSE